LEWDTKIDLTKGTKTVTVFTVLDQDGKLSYYVPKGYSAPVPHTHLQPFVQEGMSVHAVTESGKAALELFSVVDGVFNFQGNGFIVSRDHAQSENVFTKVFHLVTAGHVAKTLIKPQVYIAHTVSSCALSDLKWFFHTQLDLAFAEIPRNAVQRLNYSPLTMAVVGSGVSVNYSFDRVQKKSHGNVVGEIKKFTKSNYSTYVAEGGNGSSGAPVLSSNNDSLVVGLHVGTKGGFNYFSPFLWLGGYEPKTEDYVYESTNYQGKGTRKYEGGEVSESFSIEPPQRFPTPDDDDVDSDLGDFDSYAAAIEDQHERSASRSAKAMRAVPSAQTKIAPVKFKRRLESGKSQVFVVPYQETREIETAARFTDSNPQAHLTLNVGGDSRRVGINVQPQPGDTVLSESDFPSLSVASQSAPKKAKTTLFKTGEFVPEGYVFPTNNKMRGHYKKPEPTHEEFITQTREWLSRKGLKDKEYEFPRSLTPKEVRALFVGQSNRYIGEKIKWNGQWRSLDLAIRAARAQFNLEVDTLSGDDLVRYAFETLDRWNPLASNACASSTNAKVGNLTPQEKADVVSVAVATYTALHDPLQKLENNRMLTGPFLKSELTAKDKLHRPRLVWMVYLAHNLALMLKFRKVMDRLKQRNAAEDPTTPTWMGKSNTRHSYRALMDQLQRSEFILTNGDDCVSSKRVEGQAVIFSTDVSSFDQHHSYDSAEILKEAFGESAMKFIHFALGPCEMAFGESETFGCNEYFLKSGSAVTTLFNSVLRWIMEYAIFQEVEFTRVEQAAQLYEESFIQLWNMPVKLASCADSEYSINSHIVTREPEQSGVTVKFERVQRMLETAAFNAADRANLNLELNAELYDSWEDFDEPMLEFLQSKGVSNSSKKLYPIIEVLTVEHAFDQNVVVRISDRSSLDVFVEAARESAFAEDDREEKTKPLSDEQKHQLAIQEFYEWILAQPEPTSGDKRELTMFRLAKQQAEKALLKKNNKELKKKLLDPIVIPVGAGIVWPETQEKEDYIIDKPQAVQPRVTEPTEKKATEQQALKPAPKPTEKKAKVLSPKQPVKTVDVESREETKSGDLSALIEQAQAIAKQPSFVAEGKMSSEQIAKEILFIESQRRVLNNCFDATKTWRKGEKKKLDQLTKRQTMLNDELIQIMASRPPRGLGSPLDGS
jgi:hypothetical protein